MRIYNDFTEALPEIQRDLVEMGIKVHPKTYQDKNVARDPQFETLELQDYIYTVVNPDGKDLSPTQPWADQEFCERILGIDGTPVNPGEAWTTRREVWKEFLKDGYFAYTYSERFAQQSQVLRIINRLSEDKDSRQLYVSIWNPTDTKNLGGISRVPCSLGYLIQVRKDHLNLTYLQRSCDFVTHFTNDIYLAWKFQEFVASQVNISIGTITHWIGSLHIFKKDGKGVF